MNNKNKNELFIKFFKALSNAERLDMIQLLKTNKEMYAQDVEKHFYLEQSTTSHHLNTLKRAGIAKCKKRGRHIFYSIDEEKFKELWDEIGKILFE